MFGWEAAEDITVCLPAIHTFYFSFSVLHVAQLTLNKSVMLC